MIDLTVGVLLLFFSTLLTYFAVQRVYRKIKLAKMSSPQYRKIYSSKTPMRKNLTTEVERTNIIGMVKCEYCGALMPQLAISCPNCGAARKK